MSSCVPLLTMCQEASDSGQLLYHASLGVILYKVSDPQDSPETGGRGDRHGEEVEV